MSGIVLTDAYPVPDTYVEALGRTEVTGNNVRLTFCTARAKDGGEVDHEITERIVLPIEAVIPAVRMLLMMPVMQKMVDLVALVRRWSALELERCNRLIGRQPF
jgi:hypothetical protein